MEQNGIFEGKIVGAGTKLRTEHSNIDGNATVISTHGAGLVVKATKKWKCDVADPAKNWKVGDTWIYVTNIGSATVSGGWMAVIHDGQPIVNLTVDLPDAPPVPTDKVVVASLTLDFNAAHEIVGIWTNNSVEWTPYVPPIEPPVG